MNAGVRNEAWRGSTTWRSCTPPRLGRQQLQEGAEVGLVEFLGGRELPQDRPEPGPELGHAGLQEPLDGVAGLPQQLRLTA